MSGINDAIALIEATPVEDLVQGEYVFVENTEHGSSVKHCAIGVLAQDAGVSPEILAASPCTPIEQLPRVREPVAHRFGLTLRQQWIVQAAFDGAPTPSSGKQAALHMLRDIAAKRKLPIS